ncbi:MAG: HAD family hydrolase [Rothia sp. (in: high G+C Gram-positive bacteria)]|uniref:HAD family hydrolase n=1 Tax=Rothia sp. (in: high G+C Gram-positive bacteria) TaxID=1885016 RepID=UPI0026DD449A|nr:HAD family hydrolase [Rothia sp. (in: high G+C Gram-positive bacteria)]MDO4883313.1 HAD family hydrolase [Rothia sp. (in: high G+C Gram-positive bacteria)]
MKKLMAFDLDGTLLFNRVIDHPNVAAIARWQEDGNLAVCATGKSIFATKIALETTGVTFDYNVLYTGAVVTDADYNVLHAQTLPVSVVRACYERFKDEEGVVLFATTLTHDYRLTDGVGSVSDILPAFLPLAESEIDTQDYVGVPLWIPEDATRERAYQWILEEFGDTVDCHKNQDFLDIVPPQCTKATGLAWLVEYLKPAEYETYTIGDSWNDVPMHEWADHAASFSYSPDDVKAQTEVSVDHAWEFIDSSSAA